MNTLLALAYVGHYCLSRVVPRIEIAAPLSHLTSQLLTYCSLQEISFLALKQVANSKKTCSQQQFWPSNSMPVHMWFWNYCAEPDMAICIADNVNNTKTFEIPQRSEFQRLTAIIDNVTGVGLYQHVAPFPILCCGMVLVCCKQDTVCFWSARATQMTHRLMHCSPACPLMLCQYHSDQAP